MSKYIVNHTRLSEIANSIRNKTGSAAPLAFPEDFIQAITSIQPEKDNSSSRQYALITVAVKRENSPVSGATVTAVKGETVLSGTTDENGECELKATEAGTYYITSSYEGFTSSQASVTVGSLDYAASLSFFSATITISTETGATVTVTKGDKTYTATAEDMKAVITVYETGTYSITSTFNGNYKTKEVTVSTSANYNVSIFSSHLVLEDTSWGAISAISAEGNPQNYFAIGDTKSVHISGKIVNDTFDVTLYAYIIGFNHNESVEGKAIHFGAFKTADGKDVALVESLYGTNLTGADQLGFSYGNVITKGPDRLLCKIFGQSEYTYDVSDMAKPIFYCNETAITAPTADGFIAALPADLRVVMKKVPKSFFRRTSPFGTVNSNPIETYDFYLNIPSEYEVFGTTVSTAQHLLLADIDKYQKQYEYYANGNSKIKYKHNSEATACKWWLRDQPYANDGSNYAIATNAGVVANENGRVSLGLSPIFFV